MPLELTKTCSFQPHYRNDHFLDKSGCEKCDIALWVLEIFFNAE